MCSCGCNTCETKIRGPLLTEGKVKSLLSEGLQYHIDKKIPLFETVYRIGSEKHLALIKEARKMYSRNVIDLCEEDEALIKTHLGEFGVYKGESVPLDLPMLNEGEDALGIYNDGEGSAAKIEKHPRLGYIATISGEYDYQIDDKSLEKLVDKLKKDGFSKKIYESLNEDEIEEAEFKGKDVPLNKPKRGGSKAYYVYVRDPKTKRIKKVSFGSGGLRAKIRNKKARNAFAKRHRCPEKKDRTKASYWSCNLPRYASALGLGANMNTYW